jgi:hypothetical protein
MAAQGVSFFNASGDFGDIGDPQDNTRMRNQTLVGGTLLSTNPLTAGLPNPVYPNNYYVGETAWTRGSPPKNKDVSGGGIMDGKNKNDVCNFFCGDPVPIPDYQVGVGMATNGGSTTLRNYPDVSQWLRTMSKYSSKETPRLAAAPARPPHSGPDSRRS